MRIIKKSLSVNKNYFKAFMCIAMYYSSSNNKFLVPKIKILTMGERKMRKVCERVGK